MDHRPQNAVEETERVDIIEPGQPAAAAQANAPRVERRIVLKRVAAARTIMLGMERLRQGQTFVAIRNPPRVTNRALAPITFTGDDGVKQERGQVPSCAAQTSSAVPARVRYARFIKSGVRPSREVPPPKQKCTSLIDGLWAVAATLFSAPPRRRFPQFPLS